MRVGLGRPPLLASGRLRAAVETRRASSMRGSSTAARGASAGAAARRAALPTADTHSPVCTIKNLNSMAISMPVSIVAGQLCS